MTKSRKTPANKPAKIGRPSDFNQEIADTICERIAKGETLTDICESLEINRIKVYRWTRADEAFRNQYAQAREDQMHSFADEILKTSRDSSRDVIETVSEKLDKETGEVIATKVEKRSDNTAVQRDRLIVDSMKFLMARLAPRYYGEKVEQTIQGPDGSGLAVNVFISRKVKDDGKKGS